MPLRPLSLALAVIITSGAASAQTPAATEGASTLDTIIVTGTRVSGRTLVESQSPIDIITPETLAATGTVELATALARALPSLNFPRPAIVGATGAIRPAQLRGLSPDQVLVLVNGKRRHTSSLLNLNGSIGRGSAPVDLNTIPVSAIERVEVLRDGASAQYGSDAIAGVVNVVLKGARQGGRVSLTGGQYSAGDGEQWQLAADTGLALGQERGFLHLSAQFGEQDRTNRARPYSGAPSATQPVPGQKVAVIGDPDIDTAAFSANARFTLNDTLDVYGFGAASNRDATSFAFYRAATHPTQNVPSIYPNGFLPHTHTMSKDRSLVAGAKGDAGGWMFDLSYNYGLNRLEFHSSNTLNASLGAASPTGFYGGALETTQNIANLDLYRPLDWGLAYPVTLAFGLEARNEKWNQSPGEYGSYANALQGAPNAAAGAQGSVGFAPEVSGAYDRDSYAVYIGLELDFSERFSGGMAARWEDFDDFGSQASGKVSARYAFTDTLALRGTVASGFRAPALAQQYYQTVSTLFIPPAPDPFEVRTFPANSPIAQAFGAEPLEPETSLSYSLGLVLQPAGNLYITVDAYQIEVDDRITLSTNLTGPAVRALLESQGIFGVNGGRYFTNAIDTRTRGVDVIGTWNGELPGGSTIDVSAGYNYTKTKITRIAPNPPQLSASGLNLERIDRLETGRIEHGYPHNKFLLGASWNVHDWAFSATTTRYGSIHNTPNTPTLDQTYGGKWLLDVSASYKPDKHWSFTLGADNVLNKYPDESIFGNSFGGQFPYSNFSPFGFNGAFVYARAGYQW